ncbi:MAG: alkaline phosphatase family protein [Gemmatimonadota bacterium]|nr:alkaline phosphatase family protein [Gemmatimonadota bacterium]
MLLAACSGDAPPPDGPPAEDGSGRAESSPAATRPKVLVIGIDGVRPDVLAEVPTPALDGLIAQGAYTDSARTGFPSVSGPGWSSMLTGVWSDKHGVTDNEFGGKNYEAYPGFLDRIEQLRPELNTFAAVDWTPLALAEDGSVALGSRIDERQIVDGYEIGWAEADEWSVDAAAEHLRSGDPDALFVYLGNPDEVSHETGAIGREYREAIELADRHVARLLDAMRERATWADEDWLVLVSTDHGRLPTGGHGGDTPEERTIFYLAAGPSVEPGRPEGPVHVVDVAVTALAHLGFEADPTWGLEGRVVGLRR